MKTDVLAKAKWQFSTIEELIEHVANLVDVEPISARSLRVKGGQLGALGDGGTRTGAGPQFRNPILNYITSAHGELVVGPQSYNMRARHLGIVSPGPLTDSVAATSLSCSVDASGLEFCMADDGTRQTYSDGQRTLSFKAYRETTGPYWEMGTVIRTTGSNFEAAAINSRYYGEAWAQTCGVHKYDDDSDTNDDHLDEYEWGFFSQPPIRVESLCRVQWNGRRLSGVVSAGRQCLVVDTVQPWPDGWPPDWPPLNPPDPVETVQVGPRTLRFFSRPSSPSMTKTLTINSSFLIPVTVTVDPAVTVATPSAPDPFQPPPFGGTPTGTFNNASGPITIPPGGSVNIAVTFTGESGLGMVSGSLQVSWNTGQVTIALQGTLLEEAIP